MTRASLVPPRGSLGGDLRTRLSAFDQGYIVAAVALGLIAVFAVLLEDFLTPSNLLGVALNSSVLGILAVGMAVVVIGRGIDLSIVVIMGLSAQLVTDLLVADTPEWIALAAGLGMALGLSAINGVLVAYVEIPALFVTLATSLLFVGFLRLVLLQDLSGRLPGTAPVVGEISRGNVLGVPTPVLLLAGVVVVAHLLLTRSKVGRFIHAQGDNPAAAALTGIPTRPLTVTTYLLAGCLAFLAGIVALGLAGGYDARALTGGSLLYDVIAVVVIGGVSLAGGRGTVGGVLAAALLIGVLINGMTLLNFDTIQQLFWKAVIVLGALVLDSWLHPRDEEHARPGEL